MKPKSSIGTRHRHVDTGRGAYSRELFPLNEDEGDKDQNEEQQFEHQI